MTQIASVDPPILSTRRRWTVLVVCAMALFLVGLDTTIVTTSLPAIAEGTGAGAGGLAWVADAYTIPFASLLITAGALADRFGRRRVFRIGLVVFALASVACAAAPSLELLIAARALQGVGASMLSPVALAIVVNAMRDPRERALAIGVWGAMFGVSMAAGPVTGGALVAALDWRAVFWVNVPIVAVVLLAVAVVVPESRGSVARRLDAPGQLLLVVLLAVSVSVIIEGPHIGWGAPWSLTAYGIALAVGTTFVIVERRRAAPLIDPALFRVPTFAGAIAGAVAVFVAFSATLVITTFLLQEIEGWPPVAAGAATLAMAVPAALFAPVSGALVGRVGPRIPLLIAGVGLLAGGWMLFRVIGGMHFWQLVVAYLLVGIGIGFANAPITNTAVAGLPVSRAGVAGGMASTARQIGVAVGVALATSLLAGPGPSSAEFAAAAVPVVVVIVVCGAVVLGVAAIRR
ncbi:MFS transporter [Microbacterium halotolerans]|uniref:MFS transporter n=1 Tax=Microbacterium halotolerans TaxID=246613 RepID=UPI000E6ABC21|nr:MFS transporter [Microbacterium halotolerans]